MLDSASVMILAGTRPSSHTYRRIADDAPIALWRPILWLILSGIVSALVALAQYRYEQGGTSTKVYLTTALLYIFLVVLFWTIYSLSIQATAQMLGGTGRYYQFAYVTAAISAPLTVLAAALSALTDNAVLALGLYLYWLGAYSCAVKAVHGMSTLLATASVVIAVAFCWLLAVGVVILGLRLL